MLPKKDYTFHSFLLAVSVIGILLLLGQLPALRIGPLKVKKIDILSDLRDRETETADADSLQAYSDTTFTAESIAASPEAIERALSTPTGTSQSWDISPQGVIATPEGPASVPTTPTYTPPPAQVRTDASQYGAPATLIEDFSGGGMDRFYDALARGNAYRPIRIAVMGDSFIEADIITADLREQLQMVFGGQGVGFVPFSSSLAKYRSTVKHTFEGWESYNIIKKSSAPAAVKERFCISGLVCVPSEGGWARVEGTTFRQNIARSQVARLVFTNEKTSTLDVTVNDTIQSSFTPESSALVQQIILRGDIGSIKVRVRNAAGFTGYGIVLEGQGGVSVDNFSVRSNSGMAVFGTNTSINAQIGKLLGFDLVILQYGLNAMSPDILNYSTYSAQLVRIINYVRDCFPGAAVMVMSVGDRSTKKGGEYVTMPAAKAMLAAQHSAAEQGRAAFWNTFQAMGGERSMVKFVENKWASKDYTHIGYLGGKYIATEMVRSLLYGYRAHSGESLDLEAIARPDYSVPAHQVTATSIPAQTDTVRATVHAPAAATTPATTHAAPATQPTATTAPDSSAQPAPTPAADSSQTSHLPLPEAGPNDTVQP